VATILVSGAIANKLQNGGEAWVRLSWVLGLQRLGFDVYFVEQIAPETCVDQNGEPADFERSVNLTYFRAVIERFGLTGSASLVYGESEKTSGMTYDELLDVADRAVLLVNISGHLDKETLFQRVQRRAYVDLDPGFTQFWHEEGNAGARLAGHDVYFTCGENIGKPGCTIPTGGIEWLALPPPVVLEEWPVASNGDARRFTTIASWRGPYGRIEREGKSFGLKAHEFRKFIELPERLPATFEIALDVHPGDAADVEALHRHGWQIVDPRAAASDPDAFRRYVQHSGAEFSVAQGIYVETECGWFSDRTVRYLASGKPALIQDTGFSRNYPVETGLLAFRTLDEAVDQAGRIAGDYEAHSKAARALAEEYFDSDKVLRRFLQATGIAVP